MDFNRANTGRQQFAICIQNDGYRVSLETGKIYRVLPDSAAAKHGYLRVIDESGEDYLYPKDRFVLIRLPQAVRETVVNRLWA